MIVCSHFELGRICAGLLLFVYICIVIGDPIIRDVNDQFKPPHICGYPRARTWISNAMPWDIVIFVVYDG